ncbi:hypothetical protein TNCV_1023721 [Trichonephila clavipes]|nr:hypothetical protein TNCV_1023721 [Trichonephila clavipes]
MHIEITTEKKHQTARVFCVGTINLRKQVSYVKGKKATGVKRLGRSSGEGETKFASSPRKSTRVATCEFGLPQKMVWKISRKKIINFKSNHLQLAQQITEDDK